MIDVVAKNLSPAAEARLLDKAMQVLPVSGDIYIMLRHYADGRGRCPVTGEAAADMIGCHAAEAKVALGILEEFHLIREEHAG